MRTCDSPEMRLTADMRQIVITGMPGAGKTTIGRLLAEELQLPFWDGDEAVESTTGRRSGRYAEAVGVTALHDLEATLFLDALESVDPGVLAPAASVVERAVIRRHCTGLPVVWLDAALETIIERQDRLHQRRTMSRDEIATLLDRRRPLFEELATMTVDAGMAPDEIVRLVFRSLRPSV